MQKCNSDLQKTKGTKKVYQVATLPEPRIINQGNHKYINLAAHHMDAQSKPDVRASLLAPKIGKMLVNPQEWMCLCMVATAGVS